jgi:hypothetical protein
VIENICLSSVNEDDFLRLRPAPDGRMTRVMTAIDGERFSEAWLAAVEAAQR